MNNGRLAMMQRETRLLAKLIMLMLFVRRVDGIFHEEHGLSPSLPVSITPQRVSLIIARILYEAAEVWYF